MAAQNDDLDQSLFTSMAQAKDMEDMCIEYMRMAMGMGGKLSDWATALWNEDVDSVRKMLENLGENNLKQKLKERETKLNMTAIHHVMEGMYAARIPDPVFQSCMPTIKCRDHKKVLDKLILLGADVDARDRAGYTHSSMLELFCFLV